MPIDFSKIARPQDSKRIVEPIELFQSLRVTDPAINDIWLAQGDALREWHDHRSQSDLAIVLNTGAGKTLVGLLAAQSLVNETRGHVAYACSSIQLVEQTAAKAVGYGLGITTYFRGGFSNDLYQSGQAACITTYHALFNGRSRFFRDGVVAIVFDDAHAAEHLMRDQFTLRIGKAALPNVFSQIASLFDSYFANVGLGTGYKETIDREHAYRSWFVPPFAMHERSAELQRILVEGRLDEPQETKFCWEYLRDHVDLCCLFISGQDITLTPPVVPTLSLPYFQGSVRRLYLSATLTAADAFVRTFGKAPDRIIAPKTTAGECERLILAPRLNPSCGAEDFAVAEQIIKDRKALILTPSGKHVEKWDELVGDQVSDNVTEQVEDFKNTTLAKKLALIARYDGVDLPGDTCRVMVIDELPTGVGPLERYLWEKLGLDKMLRSTIASRIVQSFGRISRGMSDHGVVILTGKSLVDWLLIPLNQAALPKFLRQQLELGIAASRGAEDCESLIGAADQCLRRDTNWLTNYQNYMRDTQDDAEPTTDDQALSVSIAEANFGNALWVRDYTDAARALSLSMDTTFEASRNGGAWHTLWLGYSYELLGDKNQAHDCYRRSRAVNKNIPPLDVPTIVQGESDVPAQVTEVARYLYNGSKVDPTSFKSFQTDLAALDGSGSANQTEEAIRTLGQYLGLEASRPEKEFGTGPDVLWTVGDGPAFNQEIKAGKEPTSRYRKEDVGQLYNHIQWVSDHIKVTEILSTFVGPIVPATDSANPDNEITVIELKEYRAVAERLHAALKDICSRALPITLRPTVYEVFRERGLLWPEVYQSMAKRVLREIP
jgi:Type III restriction enzyme, res subunit